MTQDVLIIEQFDNFLETNKFHFFTCVPVFLRLKEVGLIDSKEEPTEAMLYTALGEIKQNRRIMYCNDMTLSGDGLQINIQGIKHRYVISRAKGINEKISVRKVFQKLKDEKKHISEYLNR
jgi:hypothetical protein